MATATQVRTSVSRPPSRPRPEPTSAAVVQPSLAVRAAVRRGTPPLTLGAAPGPEPAPPIGGRLGAGEVDLSRGELFLSDDLALAVKDGGDLEVKARLPGLAEGTLPLRKRGATFSTVREQAILLRHPTLARFAAAHPTVLALAVKENRITGWVGLGAPGPVAGSKRSLADAIAKSAHLLGWAGLSKITVPTFRNQFVDGVIDVALENLAFTVGGFLTAGGSAALDNRALSFDGSAKIQIPGGSAGELLIKKDPTGALAGKLDVLVQLGGVAGTVTATLASGFVSIMGSVAYSGDRLSGKVTLVATDEPTARDITLKKPEGGGDVPIELPGPDKPAKPGKRAFCGWGQLTFRVTDWLAGSAAVIVNSKGQATIVGEIAPPKEFILFEQKEWIKRIFKVEIRAGYGIPVVGQVAIFANINLDAIAKVGPGKLYNIKLSGAYSTDPRVPKQLAIEGSLNISAFAGLRLRAEAGFVVTIIAHDIKTGVGLNAIAGVRGYVEATPRIGMREPTPGRRQYYIQGHLEIAAQPVLGFSGDLFVEIETPWWSPLSDKRWTWPLFSLEYPLPGEFGIGADVDYVLGSKQWPKIEFGEVNFDSSKFLTDVMNDNTDKGSGAEAKKPGDWKEGTGGKGPGGAKNKGGAGKKPGEVDDDLGPIGEEETFSDGKETHRIWFEQKEQTATLMMASEGASRLERKLDVYKESIELLYPERQTEARALLDRTRTQLATLADEATRLAAMKLAARKAKEVYEKNKDKPRKKTGQKKGKNGGKELAKKVKADERALRDPLSRLVVLLLEVPFKPIKRPAQMHQGQQESTEITNEKDHAALSVARAKGAKKLRDAEGGPLAVGSHNKVGLNLVKSTAGKIDKIEITAAKAKTRAGKINAGVYRALEDPAGDAQQVIATLGQKMRIANLARLLKQPIDRMPKASPVVFPVKPAELKTKAKLAKKDEKLYSAAFVKEMNRQVRLQDKGINRLSVDDWVFNINLSKIDRPRFLELDRSARIGILTELRARAEDALKTTRKKSGELKIALAEVQRALKRTQEGEDIAPAADKVEIVAGRTGQEKVFRTKLERAAGEALRKRSGTKQSIYAHLLEEQHRLKGEDTDWNILAADGSQLVILHNPDQVGGGYDKFNSALLDPPAPTAELKVWQTYLKNLMEHVGPKDINSTIGPLWNARVDAAYKDVTTIVPQESHPINRLHLPLSVEEQ